MRKPIVEYLHEHALATPEALAVVDSTTQYSYCQLWDRVARYANYLKTECGLRKGNHVVIRAFNEAPYAVLYFAVHLCGAIVVSMEKNTSDDMIADVCRQTKCAVLVSRKAHNPEFADSYYADTSRIAELSESYPRLETYEFPNEMDVADLVFTTGTTGKSKGVLLQQKAQTVIAENISDACGYTTKTVIIIVGPLNHGNALRKLLTSVYVGGATYIIDGMLSLRDFYRALDSKLGVMACCLPPSAVRSILTLTKDKISKYAETIDFIESASAPLPESDREILHQYLPNTRLYIAYGSTEVGTSCMYDCNAHRGMLNCVGKAAKNARIFIVDDQHREIVATATNPGLIAFDSEAKMLGYFNEPELTASVMQNGIIYMSDIGYMDDEGYVYVVGRADDVINVGGLKVAPYEVEEIVMAYPGVEDCICYGIKDKLLDNVPKLLVVMNKDVAFHREEIRKYLSDRLEKYKVPTVIEETDLIRKTYNGKVDRKSYRA